MVGAGRDGLLLCCDVLYNVEPAYVEPKFKFASDGMARWINTIVYYFQHGHCKKLTEERSIRYRASKTL